MEKLEIKTRECYPGRVEILGQGTYPFDWNNPLGWLRKQRPWYDVTEEAVRALLGVPVDIRTFQFLNKMYVEYRYEPKAQRVYAIYNHDGRYSILWRVGKPQSTVAPSGMAHAFHELIQDAAYKE